MLNNELIRVFVEKGEVPVGLTAEQVIQGLRATTPPNTVEMFGLLSAKKLRQGKVEDLGLVSVQKVTVAFTQYLVDAMQDSTTTPMDVFIYHGSGTGSTAEANTDTTLETEVESRATGTKVEGASANIYKSVGTVTYSATRTIREHGLFSASTAGTLLDRSVVTAINVEDADQIEWTYQLTVNAEA